MKKLTIMVTNEDGKTIKTDIVNFDAIIVFQHCGEEKTMSLVLPSGTKLSYENVDKRTFDQISDGELSEVVLVKPERDMTVIFV